MSKHEAARAQLEKQLARLLERSGKIGADLRQIHDRDWSEQAIELENDEVLKGLDEMTLGEVRRIRAAFGRMEDGTYGVCATCARAISEERLAAVPSAITCLTCAAGERG